MMRMLILLVLTAFLNQVSAQETIHSFCDSEGNIIMLRDTTCPILLYLSCTGGKSEDIDTAKIVADSLGWSIAVCAKSMNHRDPTSNEQDILNLVDELAKYSQVIDAGIVIYGFSGQGAQALSTALKFPEKFAGVITQCAHHGLISNAEFRDVEGLPILLVTRETDWNRSSNENMAKTFEAKNMNVRLLVTPGKHAIGNAVELLSECIIMQKMMK